MTVFNSALTTCGQRTTCHVVQRVLDVSQFVHDSLDLLLKALRMLEVSELLAQLRECVLKVDFLAFEYPEGSERVTDPCMAELVVEALVVLPFALLEPGGSLVERRCPRRELAGQLLK